MPKVRFIQNANWRGIGLGPGSTIQMDAATADAYIRAGQAELAGDEPAETAPKQPSVPTEEAAAIAAKPEVDRPGAPVETAADPRREARTTKPKPKRR